MSGCDTRLHLFGGEVLIKSESNARRLTPTMTLSIPCVRNEERRAKPERKKQTDGRKKDKQTQRHVGEEIQDRRYSNVSTLEVLRV